MREGAQVAHPDTEVTGASARKVQRKSRTGNAKHEPGRACGGSGRSAAAGVRSRVAGRRLAAYVRTRTDPSWHGP